MFFHPVKQSRFGWNVKFNRCDMLWIGFEFQKASKHLTTGILGMKIGMYLSVWVIPWHCWIGALSTASGCAWWMWTADLRPRALASAYQAPSGIRAVYEHGEHFERDRASSALHSEHLCQARAPAALHGEHLCHARASQAVLGEVYGQGRAQHGAGALGSNLHDCSPARSCDLPRHGVGEVEQEMELFLAVSLASEVRVATL